MILVSDMRFCGLKLTVLCFVSWTMGFYGVGDMLGVALFVELAWFGHGGFVAVHAWRLMFCLPLLCFYTGPMAVRGLVWC